MPLSQDLLTAYENADYVVFADPELVLRIGEPSRRLDALLEHEGATTAAYITAAASAVSTLAELVAAAGYPSYSGEGRDPDGDRGAEQSLLVIGIYRTNAEELGRLFGQNAIVFVEKGAAPELVVLG
jgi:hypothetical protein